MRTHTLGPSQQYPCNRNNGHLHYSSYEAVYSQRKLVYRRTIVFSLYLPQKSGWQQLPSWNTIKHSSCICPFVCVQRFTLVVVFVAATVSHFRSSGLWLLTCQLHFHYRISLFPRVNVTTFAGSCLTFRLAPWDSNFKTAHSTNRFIPNIPTIKLGAFISW